MGRGTGAYVPDTCPECDREDIIFRQTQHSAVTAPEYKIVTEDLRAYFGSHEALKGIDLAIPLKSVVAIIGPSGCGKSTYLRSLNRMHETVPHARVTGTILLNGTSIFAMDPVLVRKRVGMVFQKPNPFPTMSIFDNVAAGLRMNGMRDRKNLAAIVEENLKKAALWDEVKDSLSKNGMS